jgi:hypothetical protein
MFLFMCRGIVKRGPDIKMMQFREFTCTQQIVAALTQAVASINLRNKENEQPVSGPAVVKALQDDCASKCRSKRELDGHFEVDTEIDYWWMISGTRERQ